MKAGNWYMFSDRGEVHIGQYMGQQKGFECCVCRKGCNAHTFNIWYSDVDYETWGYGPKHAPENLKDFGKRYEPILDSIQKTYELVIEWANGDRDVYEYATKELAEKAKEGMKMALGNQIAWMGTRRKVW